MKTEKILLIGTSKTNLDGWLSMSNGLFNEFISQGFKVYYLEGQDPKKKIKFFTGKYSSHIRFRMHSILMDFLRITLVKFIFKPDYVISVPESLSLAIYLSNLFYNTPYFLYSAGTYAATMLVRRGFLSRLAMKNCKLIFVMSEFTKIKYLQFHFPKQKIVVVKSGYDEINYKIKKSISKKKGHLVFVGNCKPRKGFHVLIEALNALPKNILRSIFLNIVISDTSQNKDLGILLDKVPTLKYKIHKSISSSSLSNLFNSCQLNILPSISEDIFFEGFGIIHSEAIASGCLTVGSLNSGNTCAINKGNGFLIHQNDYLQLKDIILNIFKEKLISKPQGKKPKTWNYVVKKIIMNMKRFK